MFNIYLQFERNLPQCCAAHPASKYINSCWLWRATRPCALRAPIILGSVTIKRSLLIFQESRVISDQLGVMSERTHLFRLSNTKTLLIFQESRVISDQLGVMSERTSQADRAKKDQQIKVSHPCRYYSHHVKPPEVEVTEIILMNESQKADHKRGFFSDL
jgi:hypothetical protein